MRIQVARLYCVLADDRNDASCLLVSEGKKAKGLVSLARLPYLDFFDHRTGCYGGRGISIARLIINYLGS